MTLRRHMLVGGGLAAFMGFVAACAFIYIAREHNPQGEFFDYETGLPVMSTMTPLVLIMFGWFSLPVAATYAIFVLACRALGGAFARKSKTNVKIST